MNNKDADQTRLMNMLVVVFVVRKQQRFTRIKAHMYLKPSSQSWRRSTVGNMSGYRCVSDCRSSGRELDPGPVSRRLIMK